MTTNQGDSNFGQTEQNCKKAHPAAILLLIGSVVGGGFIGVTSNLIPATGYLNKNAWRNGEIVIICLPMAIAEYFQQKRKGVDYTKLLTASTYGFLVLGALAQSLYAWGIVISTNNLIQAQAYVLCNLHGPFIALYLLATGVKLTKYEFVGMFFSAIGCFCMVMDPNASRNTENFAPEISNKYVAVFIALLSSIFGAMFLMLNKTNSDRLPMFFLVTMFSLHIFVMTAFLAIFFDTDT